MDISTLSTTWDSNFFHMKKLIFENLRPLCLVIKHTKSTLTKVICSKLLFVYCLNCTFLVKIKLNELITRVKLWEFSFRVNDNYLVDRLLNFKLRSSIISSVICFFLSCQALLRTIYISILYSNPFLENPLLFPSPHLIIFWSCYTQNNRFQQLNHN